MNMVFQIVRKCSVEFFCIFSEISGDDFPASCGISGNGDPHDPAVISLTQTSRKKSGLCRICTGCKKNIVKMNTVSVFVTADLVIHSFVASHRNPFSALASGIPVNIIRFVSLFTQFCHSLFHCCCDSRLAAWDLYNSHLPDDTAVTRLSVFFDILSIMDHIARDLQLMTKRCKDTAEIGVIISVDDHAVAMLFLHIFHKLPRKTHLVSTKSKRKKIISLHKKCIFAIIIAEFLNRCVKNMDWIFPRSMMKECFHLFIRLCLQDKKSRTAAAVCDAGGFYIALDHNFFEIRWMILFDIIQKTQVIFIHQETDRRYMRLIRFDDRRISGCGVHNHAHKILSGRKRYKVGTNAVAAHT